MDTRQRHQRMSGQGKRSTNQQKGQLFSCIHLMQATITGPLREVAGVLSFRWGWMAGSEADVTEEVGGAMCHVTAPGVAAWRSVVWRVVMVGRFSVVQ